MKQGLKIIFKHMKIIFTCSNFFKITFTVILQKEESEKFGLKRNIQKTNIMASSPITSWQIDGETMETVRLYLGRGASKSLQMVTVAMKLKETCSLEEKL